MTKTLAEPNSEVQLYPTQKKPKLVNRAGKKWMVKYHLTYDDGDFRFKKYYFTVFGARIAAWCHYHFISYGGTVVLKENPKYVQKPTKVRSSHSSEELKNITEAFGPGVADALKSINKDYGYKVTVNSKHSRKR